MNAPAAIRHQSTNAVLMIRPHSFHPNPETAADNSFQQAADDLPPKRIAKAARDEFDRAVAKLRRAGVNVHVVDDTAAPEKPDAVFPNNWMSTHHDGRIALYPMYSEARRRERRRDVIDELRRYYRLTEVVDYSSCEVKGEYLEGTGSLVLDHVNKSAYVSLSKRTHLAPMARFCDDFAYQPLTFTATTKDGRPVYHTNVVMCIGTEFALVGLDMIRDHRERQKVESRLTRAGKRVITLNEEQIGNYAGNAMELHKASGDRLLVMSSRGLSALTAEQRKSIHKYADIVPLELPTIELAGGSARCMLATIHLPPI